MASTSLNSSIERAGAATNAPKPRRGIFSSKGGQETVAGLTFVAPALLVVIIFVFIPVIFSLYISLTSWSGNQPVWEAQYTGLSNYKELLFEDGAVRNNFFQAVRNTVYYVLGVVPLQTVFSLLLAIIVHQRFLRGRGLFRTAFYFPSITSSVVIGTVFLWIFNTKGLLNLLISGVSNLWGGGYRPVTWLDDQTYLFHNFYKLFGITIRTIPDWMKTKVLGDSLFNWIGGPSVTMLAIMLLAVWTTSGTLMIIYLAALQDIPAQLYEAASVDGATRVQQFRFITVPMLRPTTFFVITIGLIGTFQVFDQIYVISQGEPGGTTSTIAWVVYRNAFTDAAAGRGAATAFILFLVILAFTLIQRRLTGAGNQNA